MKRLLLVFGLALMTTDAQAQSTSNLPSTETQSGSQGLPTTQTQPAPPPGQQGGWYPGMPLPPPARAAAAAPDAKGEKKRTGLDITEDPDVGEVSMAESGPPPDTHVVVKGDTLWDLSARYYRNAWGWPKLWSYNPQITNPHWIYPGDIVRLSAPGTAVATATPTPNEGPRRIQGMPRGPNGVFLRQTGFVEPGELKKAGTIVGSKEEKIMLGTLDEAYVGFPKEKPFQVGERYTIYHPTFAVKHPVTGKLLGHMVEILGEGEVRAVTNGHIARVTVIDSIDPIERGFLVGPLRRQFKVVPPSINKSDQIGVVVTTMQPRDLIGTEHIVFLDLGKSEGVEIGNRFLVTRRGDGYIPILAKGPVDDKRFPRETVAEIIIVDLREHLATGVVTKSTKETRVGDRVEARRGF
ncbi:MAG: Peptidoglycan-binding lysin domain protein [Myxococcales bacterium]|nr:Peptidoglycan-binding lysin domain protein [Myxococcales bacterium]